MADNNVGQISYTVDADTAPLLTAGNQVESANKGMQREFNKTDKAAKSTEIQMKKTAMAVKKVNSGFKLQKGAAQQIGYQLQDFAVQVQGGTSALVAFGQQGSQLAGILGPGGAVVGAVIAIASALAGSLLPSLFDSGESVEDLTEKLRELIKTSTLTEAQAQVLISAEKEGIASKKELVKEADKEIDRLKSALEANKQSASLLERQSKNYKALIEGQKELTKQIIEETAARDTYNGEIEKSERNIVTFTSSTDEATKKHLEMTETVTKLVDSLKEEATTIGFTDRALALYVATQNGATESDVAAINSSFDKIDAYKKETQAIKDRDRAAKASESAKAQAPRQRAQVLGVIDEGQGARASTDLKIAEFQRLKDAAVISEQERAAAVLAVETQLQEQLGVLREAARVKQAEGLEAFALGFEAMAARVAVAAENPARVLGEDFANAASTAGDAMADSFARSIVMGDSLSESIGGIAKQFLTQILSSLIKVGAQYAINAAIGTAAATGAAAAGVATAATLATAYAPAAALASLASFGANAAPASAGIASTVALSQGLAIAGGRQYGGGVSAGSAYRVNEDGKPEMFSDGNRQYLIPGKNGNVTSNADLSSSGTPPVSVNINVRESGNASFQVQSVEQDGTTVTINALISDVNNKGPFFNALQQNSNVTPRTT